MPFAYPLAWWGVALIAVLAALVALLEYRRLLAPVTHLQRGVLFGLRALVVLAVVLALFRPIVLLPPSTARDTVVPVLVDVSRSMRLADAEGQARIIGAAEILKTQLVPALSRSFNPQLFGVGESLAPVTVDRLAADARGTDLTGALTSVRDRFRGQRVAGIVVLSDGGDTSGQTTAGTAAEQNGPPVFTIGIGSPGGLRDREMIGLTAGDPRLDQASVDLRVSAVSAGFGRTPFHVRILANGRLLKSRRIVPAADESPIDEVFTVAPDPHTPTVYTAEIPAGEGEPVTENNARSVLVSPAGRKRRVLVLEGAPGFEHSFMRRALVRDPGFEIDSVVRKGKNAEGQDTFFVQAGAGRSAALTTGFPSRREDLYAYDALVIANVEGDFFTRAQLGMASEFVAERGGGLLVLGGRSFAQHGLVGTPLEEVLPVELSDRRGLVRASYGRDAAVYNKLVVTAEGEDHPIMRIGESADQTRRLWTALPPLAASAQLGGPRPGATVLAVAASPSGGIYPVVAVQRYGQGRSMVFAGEASWRWRMMIESTDRAHEFFWRQAARWLAGPAPDPVAVTVPAAAEPGDTVAIDIDARDAAFAPAPDALVEATLTGPGGETRPLKLRRVDAASGRYTAGVTLDRPGLHRVRAEAKRGQTVLGKADRWFYVGGSDREFADPRLNENLLRRMARASGGRYVRAAEAGRVVSWLRDAVPRSATPERRDLWDQPWVLALILALLSAEWTLRRRWGLR